MAQLSTSIRSMCSKFRAAQSTGTILQSLSSKRGVTSTVSAATPAEVVVEDKRKKPTLFRNLSRLDRPDESAVKVIKDWMREGHKLKKANVEKSIERLRKYARYKHALEVSLA
jgi:hypothetical protein